MQQHTAMMKVLPVGILLLCFINVIVSDPRPGRAHVCSRDVSAWKTRRVSYPISRQTSSKTKCKFLNWWRCTTYSRRYSLAYRTERYLATSTNYFCCDGWAEDRLRGCTIPICPHGCGVGGTCESPNNCQCSSGFGGSRCNDINECYSNNGGCHHTCSNTVGSYYCRCRTGYVENHYGQCEAVCNPPCVYGTCTVPDYCECQGHYVGDACADLNECWTNNGGCAHVCTNTFGGFQCGCRDGYVLSRLTDCLPICDPSCENNGNCVGPNNCECPDTYEGDRCEIDVNECLLNNGNCEHFCENLHGTFRCSCDDGYSGTNTCTDVDECSYANCHNCTNSPGSFECICNAGYEAYDSYNCEDIDECFVGIDECAQQCSNSIGSFSCDCHEGWTLDNDMKGCTANPCVEIGVPFDGNRSCTGFTTGETCVFECKWNYRLLGSDDRECLSNGVWSGQLTSCEEILCSKVPSPRNGYVQFPCENDVRSQCSFGCDSGYFLEGNTVTECLISGNWNSTFPKCSEIQVCAPSPCVNGVCQASQNAVGGYTCDCSGTGYTGKTCAEGFVTTPEWPDVWVGDVYDLEFFAKPKLALDLTIKTDSDKVFVEPDTLSFSSKLNNLTCSVHGVRQGFVKISYVLRGREAAAFLTPHHDNIFVLKNSSHNVDTMFTPGYRLPSGCFVLSNYSTCKGQYYVSTNKWTNKNNFAVETKGITSLATGMFELPLSLNGDIVTSSMSTVLQNDNCQSKAITLDDIQYFVRYNSLYRNYTGQLENVFPDWITFISVDIDPMDATASFSALSLFGAEIKSIEWCEAAPVVSDGQYSVLLLSKAELMIGGRHVSLAQPSFKGKYCFIVGMCTMTTGEVMMVFPEGSRDISSYIRNIEYDGSFEVNVNFLAFSKNGMHNPNVNYNNEGDEVSILMNLQYSYYINNTVSAKVEGSGDVQVSLENVAQLFSHLFIQRLVLHQFGYSKIILFWKMLGEDIVLNFISNNAGRPSLYVSVGDEPLSHDRGITMESSTSFESFDDTPFSWLLKTHASSIEVFVDYDLSPKLDIPSDLSNMTEIINGFRNLPPQLKALCEQLMTVEFDVFYYNLLSTVKDLNYNINQYFQALTQKDLKQIAMSLAELRVKCKFIINTLWNVNDKLSSSRDKNNLQTDLINVTARIEHLSNRVLVEVQNLFVHESTSGSGFRINSSICLSKHLCFPSLEIKVFNSLNNCLNIIDQHQMNEPVSNVCMIGEYFITQTLNQFIHVPAGSQLRLSFACNVNYWIGNIPVYIQLLGIEQDTTMHLTMDEIYLGFSGKLWGLFDVIGNATSRMTRFESMMISVNGKAAVEGPLSLGRTLKNKIISLSQKSVDDSERRLGQASNSLKIATSTLRDALKEEVNQIDNFAKASKKHESALKSLDAANNALERARQTLEDSSHDTRELEEALANVCEIHECSGVCLPGSKLVTYVEDVYGYVPYECCIKKNESTVVTETTGCCDICYIPTPVKTISFNPIKLVTAAVNLVLKRFVSAVIDTIAFIISIKKGTRDSYSKGECCEECQKTVLVTATFQSCSTCARKEVIGQIEKFQTEDIPCSVHIPDANCVRENEQCRKQRSRAFDQIKQETHSLAVPIKEFDDAVLRASVAEAVLNEALIDLDDALNQQKEVSDRVMILKKHFNNSQDALKKIRRDVEAGLIVKQHQINGSLEESLELKKLHFNIDLVEEDTSVIPFLCYITLSSTPVQIQVFIDSNNLNYSIENAALFITEELFGDVTRSVRRRRGVTQRRFGYRNRRDTNAIIEQPPMQRISYNLMNNSLDHNITSSLSRDQHVIQNEERCTDYNSILGFIEHSFQTLLEILNDSKVANAQALETKFQNDYMYNLSLAVSPSDVNTSALLYFNLTMSDLEESNTGDGVEKNALSKVIDSSKRKTNNTKALLEVDLMTKWKTVVDQYTRNASGITDCEGFYDCLTAELIALKYLSEGTESYQNVIALDEYVSTFLNGNLSSSEELETSGTIVLSRVIFLKDYNDVCLEAPIITQHPEPKLTTIEGENITLTCQATGNPLPTFSWKFNGQILSGMNSNSMHLNQVNSSNSGLYTCQASNAVTKVSSLQSHVTVEFAPLITEHPQDTVIEHGNIEGAYFTCQASARPLADYQWYFQASSSDMELIPGQNGSIIEILSPTFNQDGWYVCEASNNHGKKLSNPARLHVLDISMPEFSSKISIGLYRVDSSNSTNASLNDVVEKVISSDDPDIERLNYQEFTPNGKSFLRQITFEIKSTNMTSINMVNVSRQESAYKVKDKIDSIIAKVVQLQNVLTPGDIFDLRGEAVELIEFNADLHGPICPKTQYAHDDGYICVNCPPGSYRGNDNLPAMCQKCPRGFYQPEEGKTECLKLHDSTTEDIGSSIHSDSPSFSSSTPPSEEKPMVTEDDSNVAYMILGCLTVIVFCMVCLLIYVVFSMIIRRKLQKVDKKQGDKQYEQMKYLGRKYIYPEKVETTASEIRLKSENVYSTTPF